MSKYDRLWKAIQDSGSPELTLSFDEIAEIAGVGLDHSFLRFKKELTPYGYEVGKISLKAQTAVFHRLVLRSGRLLLSPCSRAEMERMIRDEADEGLKTAYGEMLSGALQNPAAWIWHAVWRIDGKDGVRVGDLSFKGLGPDGTVELGYGILEGSRDRGYASEAVGAIVDWAARQPCVKRIEAETEPGNLRSQRVLAKCGFVPTGVMGEEGPRYVWRAAPK